MSSTSVDTFESVFTTCRRTLGRETWGRVRAAMDAGMSIETFPSCIGNIRNRSLYDIYHSKLAARYRAGSQACRACDLNLVCRGCLAIAYSLGLDIFEEKDPFCFDTRAPLTG